MKAGHGVLAAALVLWLVAGRLPAAAQDGPPIVTGVDLSSRQRLPETRLRPIVADLVGRPRDRGEVRERLDRLWALGLFSEARVEEVDDAGGVRLRFVLARRPHVGSLAVRGEPRLAEVDIVEAAALAVGADAADENLARAARAVKERLERDGFLDAQVRIEAPTDAETAARDVTLIVLGGKRTRIGEVHVNGLEHADLDAVRRELGLEPGQPFRRQTLERRRERLERWLHEHRFPSARVSLEPGPWDRQRNRVDIDVRIEEGPEVEVVFEGRDAVAEKDLRARLTFGLALAVDDSEVATSAREIQALYRERGHLFATVRGSIESRDGQVRVRFTIDEGPRVLVESVTLGGDTGVPTRRLLDQMATRPSDLFGRPPYVAEVLDADVARLTVFLRSEGFPGARVDPPEVDLKKDRTAARIVITVAAGPPATVGTVRVLGTTVLEEAALRAAVPLRPGKAWSQVATDEGQRAIEQRYRERGYHGARVDVVTRTHDAEVDVTYRVAEGPLTRIGRILVGGLTVTREHVVRRELPFVPDDPLDPRQLAEAQRRLAGLGLFERVDVQPLRPPPRPYVDVHVEVREAKPWRLDLGLGYTQYDGARAFVILGHDNLFGTGRSASLRGRVSQRGYREELAYREPWLLGTRWTGDLSVYHERRDEIGYDFERVGLGAGVERELLADRIRGLHGALRYKAYYVDRWNVDETLDDETVIPGTEFVSSITPELILDRRDRPFDPRRGSLHLVSLETGGVFLGGESNFLKARLETAWFLDWLAPTVIALGARVGLAGAVLGSAELPNEERFYAGGSTTVRGYRERRLGPLDDKNNPLGGNAQVILNVEWRFPIWRWLGGTVFFDTGEVTSEVADLAPGELKSGVGGGLNLTTPVGPIRLDMGWPLDSAPGQSRKLRFYLTVGHPF